MRRRGFVERLRSTVEESRQAGTRRIQSPIESGGQDIRQAERTRRREENIRRMQQLRDATPPEVLQQQRLAAINRARAISGLPPREYKKGGLVQKTGLALVHKGEVVIPAHRVATVDKALKKAGLKPLKK